MSSEIPRNWRLKEQRYRLIGEVCGSCEEKIFPPRDICPHCGQPAKKKFEFSGKGKVYSFTTIYEAPTGFQGLTPYTVALVELDEGPKITAQLTDLENHTEVEDIDGEMREVSIPSVQIGMSVEMVTRKLRDNSDETGVIPYGYKFRPSFATEASLSSR